MWQSTSLCNLPFRLVSMNKKERQFVVEVLQWYRTCGRHDLPWRKTNNPYHILVSEMMLQQTQVARVVPKYRAFLKQFPTARRLAAAPLGDVLRAWQGLGYNRRAKFLWQAAQQIMALHKGVFPKHEPALRSLSGVGTYTAAAIMTFAYNQPVVVIETNIRQVFLHHFFQDNTKVHDNEIALLIQKTLPAENAREWYSALMDYGSHLKQVHGNLTARSTHYKKQSIFKGSDRQIRGMILSLLAKEEIVTKAQYRRVLAEFSFDRVQQQLDQLEREAMIVQLRGRYRLQ
ncbi:MAG: hypothetical protein RL097_231 [Candidatus Parcubacteria bacterium]